MKQLKTASIIGIIISALAVLASIVALFTGNISGLIGIIIYGYFLWFSIISLSASQPEVPKPGPGQGEQKVE